MPYRRLNTPGGACACDKTVPSTVIYYFYSFIYRIKYYERSRYIIKNVRFLWSTAHSIRLSHVPFLNHIVSRTFFSSSPRQNRVSNKISIRPRRSRPYSAPFAVIIVHLLRTPIDYDRRFVTRFVKTRLGGREKKKESSLGLFSLRVFPSTSKHDSSESENT